MIRKLKTTLFGLVFFTCGFITAQNDVSIETGDSLFVAKKYTEAMEVYSELHENGQGSSAMLLKMAFIQEGLRDHVKALYYLNGYYKLTHDKSVLHKMQELADEHGLSGYEVEDKHFFVTNLNRYQQEIQLGLAVACLVLVIVAFRGKRKNQMPVGVPIVQVVLLVGLFVVSNDVVKVNRAIVNEPTLLMTGPSAAAEVFESIDEGHQVEILEESDVWAKVRWEEEEVYVRKGKLLIL